MCEYKQKNTRTRIPSRTQKLAQIEVIALSMCWGVMISAICNKNELKIQEISWLLCVGCGIYANEVKIHTFRGWINSAKTGALFYSAQKVSSEGQRNLAIKTKPRPILFAYWAELSVAGPKRNYQRDIHCSSFFLAPTWQFLIEESIFRIRQSGLFFLSFSKNLKINKFQKKKIYIYISIFVEYLSHHTYGPNWWSYGRPDCR